MIQTHEICHFRLIRMPCCSFFACWVNPRLPNYCPECGKFVYAKLKSGEFTHHNDETAELLVHNLGQGLLGGVSAREEDR
jgi:hypothetical protein